MTGPDVRALLAEWGVSRRIFADHLAAEGFYIHDATIGQWKDTVPSFAVRLIERWRDNPKLIPGKTVPHITRRRLRNWR
jgi:hypothetical protein